VDDRQPILTVAIAYGVFILAFPGKHDCVIIGEIRILEFDVISMAAESQILEELRKIREAVTPKPVPPAPPPPRGLWAEFKDFLGKAGVLGLAIGFIMGTYIGKVVSAFVQDIIMPVPGALIPGGDWRKAVVSIPVGNGMNFAVGDFVGVIIDFAIVAAVIFVIAKHAEKMGLK
jgi:large conductance mechanosensitive channel